MLYGFCCMCGIMCAEGDEVSPGRIEHVRIVQLGGWGAPGNTPGEPRERGVTTRAPPDRTRRAPGISGRLLVDRTPVLYTLSVVIVHPVPGPLNTEAVSLLRTVDC